MSDTLQTTAPIASPSIVPDQWSVWRRLLAGDPDVWSDVNPDNIQAGFWRDGNKAIAVWFGATDGKLRCKEDGRSLDEAIARERWHFYVKRPVTKEAYDERILDGNWPGETEAVTYISNNPPADDSLDAILAAIQILEEEAKRFLKRGEAVTKREADEVANCASLLSDLWTKADNARKAEKQPWKEKAEAVDEKWRPVTAAAAIYETLKSAILTPFQRMQKAAKEKAAQRAREEVEKAQREAAEKERAAKAAIEAASTTGDTRAIMKAEQEAETARSAVVNAEANARAIEAAPVTIGTRGRKIASRSVTIVTIEDRPKVLAFFESQESTAAVITELLQKLAENAVKAKLTVPGVKVFRDTVAA